MSKTYDTKYDNVFYFYYLNRLGGTENFLYSLAKKYQDFDITIVYSNGTLEQILRLSKYARCIKWDGRSRIKCKKVFFNYNFQIIDYVDADEYNFVIHGDYEYLYNNKLITSLPIHNKITHYYGVSKAVCESWKRVSGKDATCVYNPVAIDKGLYPKKTQNKRLTFISATRLTSEKGGARMVNMMKMLNNAHIDYEWHIYTGSTPMVRDSKHIFVHKPTLDILPKIAEADYLVQLSDSESYCYSIVESLCLGVPVITTPILPLKEIGVDETNSIVVPFDMKDIPFDKIIKHDFNFDYTPVEDKWGGILVKGKNLYKEEREMKYLVEATSVYDKYKIRDIQLECVPKRGDRWIVDYDRYKILTQNPDWNEGNGKALIKVIKEIPDAEALKQEVSEAQSKTVVKKPRKKKAE